MSASATDATKNPGRRRFFHRARWERITTGLIFAGLFMLMQPFSLTLYTYSFVVILAGTFGFAIATKLPE